MWSVGGHHSKVDVVVLSSHFRHGSCNVTAENASHVNSSAFTPVNRHKNLQPGLQSQTCSGQAVKFNVVPLVVSQQLTFTPTPLEIVLPDSHSSRNPGEWHAPKPVPERPRRVLPLSCSLSNCTTKCTALNIARLRLVLVKRSQHPSAPLDFEDQLSKQRGMRLW